MAYLPEADPPFISTLMACFVVCWAIAMAAPSVVAPFPFGPTFNSVPLPSMSQLLTASLPARTSMPVDPPIIVLLLIEKSVLALPAW